ncbi:RNA polymerase subunit sigma-24 [Aeromicrobium sp. PE09-221]|uniref:RNA polymerase sigma factor n=1 Tax=Aeromicrobium sp. PE09-221 TaxID=1898043 RepID=UPI000B3E9FD5|nr:DUF6596 domain-containing protein [Aeromicrobium sp. PE09-221]OUZ12458.1 RNA polymerase subunit sigma-24 [Aeromicrobium sp. PE09-221]
MTGRPDELLARLHRDEWARLVAVLARQFGDIDLAEEVAQAAMETALVRWPNDGVPRSPSAWLLTTARRAAVDRVRRDAVYTGKLAGYALERPSTAPPAESEAIAGLEDVYDEQLAMMMACCHPAIGPADQIAMMLRFAAGLTTQEVAAGLLQSDSTLQARITRAKKRIAANRIPLAVPREAGALSERLDLVLSAISLIYTTGYDTPVGERVVRAELTGEALRLARIVLGALPEEAEAEALVGLLLLTQAREAARIDEDGVPVALEDQDRRRWDAAMIAEGTALVERAARRPTVGRFTIQAAIAAVHAEASSIERTDWRQIVVLYDLLLARGDDPIVRMNRAIAIARRDSPAEGLVLLRNLEGVPELERHHPFHASLALLYTEVGDAEAARAAWERALDLVEGAPQRRFIQRRLEDLR